MTDTKASKTCFFITPIGSDDSAIRRRSDQIRKHILEPALNGLGYRVVRSDMIAEPGIITDQIIRHILDDELAIADLTGNNANVFYELAVRHLIQKPVIQICQSGERPPFDVSALRYIPFDHTDLDSAAFCRDAIRMQVEAIENDPTLTHSPISATINLSTLQQSNDPTATGFSEILSRLQGIENSIFAMRSIASGGGRRTSFSGGARSENALWLTPNWYSDYAAPVPTDVDRSTVSQVLETVRKRHSERADRSPFLDAGDLGEIAKEVGVSVGVTVAAIQYGLQTGHISGGPMGDVPGFVIQGFPAG